MEQKFSKNLSLFHTGKEHIIKPRNTLSEITTISCDSNTLSDTAIKEYDKPVQNMDRVNNISMEMSMQDSVYEQLEMEESGMKIILMFPYSSDDVATIHEEVKQILSNLLQEQISQAT